jgi:hypothetical protein
MATQNPQEPESEPNKEVYGWVSVPVDVKCDGRLSDGEVRAALLAQTAAETDPENVEVDSSEDLDGKKVHVRGWASIPVETELPAAASDEEVREALLGETAAETTTENVEVDHVGA